MTTELTDSIHALRALAPRLNKATDQAAALVHAVETFLTEECSIGVTAWVTVSNREEVEDEATYRRVIGLGYERCGSRFRIVVNTCLTQDDGELLDCEDAHKTIPWFEAPRDVRLETFTKLPALLERVAEEAAHAVEAAEQSSGAAEQVIAALGVER